MFCFNQLTTHFFTLSFECPNFFFIAEENLLLKEKVRRINNALDSDPVDIEALRAFGLSAYGYVTDDIRCRVWPKLLNVNVYNLPRRKEGTVKCNFFLFWLSCLQ